MKLITFSLPFALVVIYLIGFPVIFGSGLGPEDRSLSLLGKIAAIVFPVVALASGLPSLFAWRKKVPEKATLLLWVYVGYGAALVVLMAPFIKSILIFAGFK